MANKTLALNPNDWDLYLGEDGNIATVEGQAQKSQDVATSVKVWQGEYIFDTTRGLPYNLIMTKPVNRSLLQEYIGVEARRIDGVRGTTVVFNDFENRQLDFDVLVSTDEKPLGEG